METINHIISFSEATLGPLSHQITPIGSTALAASVIALSVLFTGPHRLAQIRNDRARCAWNPSFVCSRLRDVFFRNWVRIGWPRAFSEQIRPFAEATGQIEPRRPRAGAGRKPPPGSVTQSGVSAD
jgi:hypothetical protein